MNRRAALSGGLLAGLAGAVWPTLHAAPPGRHAGDRDAAANAPQASERAAAEIAEVLREIRDELRRDRTSCAGVECRELEQVRANQRAFLRAQGKFPDFIDVSLDIWEKIYDYHVRVQLPTTVVRLPDGRYGLTHLMTTIVLRHEMAMPFISVGYDQR